jgi:hypothetical protein
MANSSIIESELSFVYSTLKGDAASMISTTFMTVFLALMCVLKVAKIIMKYRKQKLSTPQVLAETNMLMENMMKHLSIPSHSLPHESSDQQVAITPLRHLMSHPVAPSPSVTDSLISHPVATPPQ